MAANSTKIRRLAKEAEYLAHLRRETGLQDFGNMGCEPRPTIQGLTSEQALEWLEGEDEYPPLEWLLQKR